MTEVTGVLDFGCSCCECSVNVKLTCMGKGLTASSRTVATVNVPCPHCNQMNQLLFEPNGTVRAVRRYQAVRTAYPLSLN